MLKNHLRALTGLTALTVIAAICPTSGTIAAEGGSGVYLLGLRGPNAAITPPQGIFLTNQFYGYAANAKKPISLGGFQFTPEARVKAFVNLSTLTWVTPLELLGGQIGFTATVPVGHIDVRANAGPLRRGDSIGTIGDPAPGAFIGWKFDNFHVQYGATAFLPVGDYRDGALANISKNRGALDLYGAVTWAEPNLGLSISGVAGYTANQTNKATNYRTGNELHIEGAMVQKLTKELSVGLVGYHYQQLGDDRGPGAALGAFRGRSSAVGGMAGYTFMVDKIPVSTQIRVYKEVDVLNRFKGNAGFLSVSMPLWVRPSHTTTSPAATPAP